ncbi:hypothetical protein BGZ81_007716 [Podila clonocystis]|nr:hypothetical protein BGZ81_007716 [Podila clonocystis]
MRIQLSTALLLFTATTLNAAPTPPAPTDATTDAIIDQLKVVYDLSAASKDCITCVSALVTTKTLDHRNRPGVLKALKKLCPTLQQQPTDVCDGMVDRYGAQFLDMLQQADIAGEDGKLICYGMYARCPAPPLPTGALKFPKARPINPTAPAQSGELVDVLHLSDWHVDHEYSAGAEAQCDRPQCCRKYPGASETPIRAASSWGDYNCDTPSKLAADMLTFIPKVSKASFTILTGDLPAHDTWLGTIKSTIEVEHIAYETMSALPSKIYPTIGNHESFPASLFNTPSTGSDQWLYNSLAKEWSRWLPADSVASARHYGAYSASPAPGLRIISLNTNFCYKKSFFNYADTHDTDPLGELQWLIHQLQAAEDAGERVWIIAHVGPTMSDCLRSWSHRYNEVIQRYSPHVVAEQFFGHKHYDDFALYYGPDGVKSAANAIATAWIGPSVTTLTNLNPGFRVYKVDTKSWNVFDSLTYVADISKGVEWDATEATPDWHLEYSAREAYSPYAPLEESEPLSASWWHNVAVAFETNDIAFQKFWLHRSKSSGKIGACPADSACPSEIICRLKNGQSAEICPNTSGIYRRSLDDMATVKVRRSQQSILGQGEFLSEWDKPLCGTSMDPLGFH